MKKILAPVVFILLAVNVSAQNKEGWISLFDGKTTTGWHSFNKPGSSTAWTVNDKAIYLDVAKKEGRGDLVTNQEFGDFHLKFEWKVAPKSNSGLIFLVQEADQYGATWYTGPEFQLLDNTGYPEKLQPKQLAGSLFDLTACPPENIKPTGEWNSSEIILEKAKLVFIVNGKKVVETTLWNDEWNKMVSGSKFVEQKDFAKSPKGRIALQDHGGEVWFKNIMIKNL